MTQSTLVAEPGNGTLEIFALPTDTELLRTLIADVFQNHGFSSGFWGDIR